MSDASTMAVSTVTAAGLPGPHHLPQPEQHRIAVDGKRFDARGWSPMGGEAVLVVIRDPARAGWVVYLECDPARAVMLPDESVAQLVAFVSDSG